MGSPALRRQLRADRIPALSAWIGIALLFTGVFVLRLSFYNPHDGVGILYCIPVVLAAIRFGPSAGAACGVLALGLFIAWAAFSDAGEVEVFGGLLPRVVVFLGMGWLIGHFARARDEIDRSSRELFDLSPDLMATLDGAARVTSSNRAWIDAFGEHVEVGAGGPVPIEQLRATQPGGSTIESASATRKGEERWIEWRSTPTVGGKVHVVGRDVTERRRAKLRIRTLLVELQQAREAERRSIATDLHDFLIQQIIAARLQVEHAALSADASANERLRLALHQMDTALRSARRIIDGISPLDLEHLRPSEAIRDLLDELQAAYGYEIDAQVDLERDEWSTQTVLLYRLVSEPLHNAGRHAEAQRVSVDVRSTRDMVRVVVCDDGHGMPGKVRAHDVLPPDAGLGLTLLLEQITLLGGHYEVESTPSAGTRLTFEIQMGEDEESPAMVTRPTSTRSLSTGFERS